MKFIVWITNDIHRIFNDIHWEECLHHRYSIPRIGNCTRLRGVRLYRIGYLRFRAISSDDVRIFARPYPKISETRVEFILWSVKFTYVGSACPINLRCLPVSSFLGSAPNRPDFLDNDWADRYKTHTVLAHN